MEQQSKEQVMAELDLAADEAEKDLDSIPNEILAPLSAWWRKWYLKTGHKRLGRILLQYAEQKKEG